MKKLLSMALAMMLLFASVGVFAEGEATEEPAAPVDPNLVWSFGAEEKEPIQWYPQSGTTKATMTKVDAATEGISLHAGATGTAVLKLEDVVTVTGQHIFDPFPGYRPVLEAGTHYRLSFWHYNIGGISTPVISVTAGGNKLDAGGGSFAAFPAGTSKAWNYYSVDLITATDMDPDTKLGISIRSQSSAKVEAEGTTPIRIYYDDFKLEKVEQGAVEFFTGSVSKSPLATILSQAGTKDRQTPQVNYTAAKDEKPAKIYAVSYLGKKTDAFSGTVKVVSTYVPKTVGEKATLCVAIYDKDGNLKALEAETYTYDFLENKTEDTINYYYLGESRINVLSVDTTPYAGGYMKAFMWNSAGTMTPVSEAAIIGK